MRAAILILLAIVGCGGGSPSKGEPSCVRTAPISVSVVNGWPEVEPEAFASALEENCQTLTEIEAFPWFDRSGLCDDAHPGLCTETFRGQRRAWLRAMSAHKVTTYVVTQNSNAVGPWRMTDEAFRAHVRAIREDAEAVGLDHVWLGSPSEPWAQDYGRGRRRAEIARDEWPGTFVLPDAGQNHATGRPYFPGIGYDYLEVHPCSIEDARASIAHGLPILTVTDCGPVLNPGPTVGADLAGRALASGVPLILYDFTAVGPDLLTTNAIGAALR